MPAAHLTCAQVEEQDLEARYLADRLTPAEAAAYEEHYFGCERCWAALRRAQEIRAALAATPAAPRRWAWRRARWPLAAAAVLILAAGLWRLEGGGGRPDGTALRGSADSVSVTALAAPGVARAHWGPTPAAARYRVRLFTADGALVTDRETADTAVAVPVESLPARAAGPLYWKVEALDGLGNRIAGSPLQRAVLPPPLSPRP